jgi:hypothetical protein
MGGCIATLLQFGTHSRHTEETRGVGAWQHARGLQSGGWLHALRQGTRSLQQTVDHKITTKMTTHS